VVTVPRRFGQRLTDGGVRCALEVAARDTAARATLERLAVLAVASQPHPSGLLKALRTASAASSQAIRAGSARPEELRAWARATPASVLEPLLRPAFVREVLQHSYAMRGYGTLRCAMLCYAMLCEVLCATPAPPLLPHIRAFQEQA
jgi:hypothetical protein